MYGGGEGGIISVNTAFTLFLFILLKVRCEGTDDLIYLMIILLLSCYNILL